MDNTNNSLTINLDEINKRFIVNNYQYTFLDNVFDKEIDISIYYNLIQSLDYYKIKNIYNFLFLRSLKIHTKFSTYEMKLNKYIHSHEELNTELSNYIKKDRLYAIIIMNGIQQYFIPVN